MTIALDKKVATSVYNVNSSKNGQKYTVVKYHHTEIVQFDQHTIVLNSGGWKTVTTKRRMNQVSSQYDLGFHVYQDKYVWYVDFNGKTVEFEDGMILDR